jgi:ribonuclease BN (tRNA processing enzyme)
MGELHLVALGVGDAFSARHYSSCLALRAAGLWLLIDCPHPIRKMLREAAATGGGPGDVDQVAGVVLSHLHADHCSGLEILGFFARFRLERRVPLLVHPRVSEHLWHGHLAGGMERALMRSGEPPEVRRLSDFFELRPLSETEAVPFGPFLIECRPTLHSVPTTAFRIRAAGRCLGYSADTAFDPGLIEWLSAADLIIHETGPGPLHTPPEKLLALPQGLRSRMRVVHYPDDFDPVTAGIEPLHQGQCYAV